MIGDPWRKALQRLVSRLIRSRCEFCRRPLEPDIQFRDDGGRQWSACRECLAEDD